MKLHDHAQLGDLAGMASELARGVPIDALYRKDTALVRAADSAEAGVDSLRFLLDQGADVNQRGRSYTALCQALRGGDLGKVAVLLEAGADCSGPEVFISALYSRGDSSRLIELLLAGGAPIAAANHSANGPSPLQCASLSGRFELVRLLLDAGADEGLLHWTPLMRAIALGSLGAVQAELEAGADPMVLDHWQRTPWLLALHTGNVEKAALLLRAGADPTAQGRCGMQPMMFAIRQDTSVLRWLIGQGFDLEARDEFDCTVLARVVGADCPAAVEVLLRAGARFDAQIVEKARSLEEGRLFLARGVALSELEFKLRSRLIGCRADQEVRADEADYRAAKQRRFGLANPEPMDNPFWLDMLDSRAAAWAARVKFEGRESEKSDEPIWCFDRFGCSITPLPDGRFIEVGGEHEDFYDPDFCIYNEVVVHDGQGNARIYGYPRELFPPTDFHSATLVGDDLYLIGSLGYSEDFQPGHTPVYRLDCTSLVIEQVPTQGDGPGWISRHKAHALGESAIRIEGGEVVVEGEEENRVNTQVYRLDLTTLSWTCLVSDGS